MSVKSLTSKSKKILANDYSQFDKLDGNHPWMDAVPEGFVSYRVKELNHGKIVYFNFTLAKEMGLISSQHPHRITDTLNEAIIKTFSIQILNEYDELNIKRISKSQIKPNRFMATRYLQLQHSNKQGKTSGDGRGIWNGVLEFKGSTWDVSSRGTGVTCLAPGAVEANKPLKTGATDFGYGCGLAEIDELLGAAILAESMHLQGIETERVLCIIDHGNGHGIGVRAAKNLIRPAHLFLYLKQGKYESLKAATDYLIDRQIKNKRWNLNTKSASKYLQMAEVISYSFAHFAANLDVDYIFAWLDWDGDNVLADAGIIDYGSIRQFGIRHDKYRYDDVQRFSTNLNEQKNKAKLIVQVFIQLADFLSSKEKKSLRVFKNHPLLKKFDEVFEKQKADRLLYRMGFNQIQRNLITESHIELFKEFQSAYEYFEKAKISGKTEKVADGVNHPALFNMKKMFKDLPKQIDPGQSKVNSMNEGTLYKLILSSYAKKRDTRMSDRQKQKLNHLQGLYFKLVQVATKNFSAKAVIDFTDRSKKLNSDDRITGNALVEIVNFLLNERKKALPTNGLQKVIDKLIQESVELPEAKKSSFYNSFDAGSYVRKEIYHGIRHLRLVHKEDI